MHTQLKHIQMTFYLSIILALPFWTSGCKETRGAEVRAMLMIDTLSLDTLPSWMIGPFIKLDDVNPCLLPDRTQMFHCPVRNQRVRWEAKDVFNPAVIVRNEMLHILYRAEDSIGRYAGTSRLGLAQSKDGYQFEKRPAPVFYPDRDQMFHFEWEGGCEDPRVVRRSDGLYIMTYTAYDGKLARLCIASSRDLVTWTKHGLAFASDIDHKYADLWSKSGAIISKYDTSGTITATKVNGKYWMYWGDKHIHLATSADLITWTPLTNASGDLQSIVPPRAYLFDSDLVEPGPPAMIRDDGILLIYNSRNFGAQRDSTIAESTYSAGQVLFDLKDPTKVRQRSEEPFFVPDRPYEITGQVNSVVFVEGLVRWKGKWWLYYGTADSKIAVAVAK